MCVGCLLGWEGGGETVSLVWGSLCIAQVISAGIQECV